MEEYTHNNQSGNGTMEPHESPFCQLLGLCEGLVADGVLSKMEAGLLKDWLSADRSAPVCDPLARADLLVSRMISEGKLSSDERGELFDILEQLKS
jgi:hypothetical protein